jgi:hypothetical protein
MHKGGIKLKCLCPGNCAIQNAVGPGIPNHDLPSN